MAIIQGRSGDSLAGIYDVVGGSFDVGRLAETEVQLVHEMGETIASERLRTDLRIVEALGVAQSTNFNVAIDDLPRGPFRLQSGVVFIDVGGRVSGVCLSMELGDGSRSIPLYSWSSATGVEVPQQFTIGGALVARSLLLPLYNAFPVLGLGTFQGTPVQQNRILRLAGATAAFGAGTVDIRAMVISTHMDIPGGQQQPISWGLPVPSW